MSRDRPTDLGSPPDSKTEANEGLETRADSDSNDERTALDPEALRLLSAEIARESAPDPAHTALVLYDRDPQHLQVQWHIAPEDLSRARRVFPGDPGDVRQVLRLRRLDQGGRAAVVASVVTRPEASKGQGEESFSLTGAMSGSGAEYECELGLETDDGGWLSLARSNRIGLTDRSHPSLRIVPDLSSGRMRHPERTGVGEPQDYADDPVEPALAAVGVPLDPVFPALDQGIAAAESVFPREERESVRELSRDQGPESLSAELQQPMPLPQRAIAIGREADIEAMPPPVLPSTLDQSRAAGLPTPLYDPRAAMSSAAPRGVQPLVSDMELQAEFVLQGRASPGSTVAIFGQSVPVGADGRFYIRRPIDDLRLLSLIIGWRQAPGNGDPEQE